MEELIYKVHPHFHDVRNERTIKIVLKEELLLINTK